MKYKYTVSNLLLNDSFVEYVLHPTDELVEYWEHELCSGLLSSDVKEQAINIITAIHLTGDVKIDPKRLDKIWNRIEATNQENRRKKRTLRLYTYIGLAAACFCFLFIFHNYDLFSYISFSSPQEYTVQVIDKKKLEGNIKVILPNQEVQLDNDDVVLDYTSEHSILIDEKEVSVDATSMNELIVPYGKRSTLLLSDGSKLWVNAGSHIKYPAKFTDDTREIYVEGEVYAEVAKDKMKPFYVRTKNLEVKVLGTSFNLMDYEEEDKKSVVLVTGSVEVSSFQQEVNILLPNQEYCATDTSELIRDVDVSEYISWVDGYYKFTNKELNVILKYLERYYGVHVSCSDKLGITQYTGGLDLKQDIVPVLNSLIFAINDNVLLSEENGSYTLYKP